MSFYPPGARIAGRYEVAGRPLMGGMGIVYLCFDHEEQRPVALKTFRPEYLPDRAARSRFLQEATYWVELGRHPHIVRCYEIVQPMAGLEVYLVLEFVAKEQNRKDASLRSWLAPNVPLPIEMALLFALQITQGMKHAASTIPGFVHRDLKPENVLIGADHLSNANINRLRVTDFGLAKLVAGTGTAAVLADMDQAPAYQQKLTRGAVGTPLYKAPEQWSGEPVGIYTDIYALGCILYEMLAGHPAAQGNRIADLERVHCTGEVARRLGELPEPISSMITKCIAVDPRARYASWTEIEMELSTIYQAMTGRSAPSPPTAIDLDRSERIANGWNYIAIGLNYRDLGTADLAMEHFERAEMVGEAEGEHSLVAAAMGNRGNVYAQLGDPHQAIELHRRALSITQEIGDRRGEGSALGNLGKSHARLGDPHRAVSYHEQALAIAREFGDRGMEASALGNIGSIYDDIGDIQRAIGFYKQALAIFREMGNLIMEGTILGNLGVAYVSLGDTRRAIGCYEQHLAIADEIADLRGKGNALGNLGSAYTRLGDPRRAIHYQEESLAIAREIGDPQGVGLSLMGLGDACEVLGAASRAMHYYSQAVTILEEIGDVINAAIVGFNLGFLLVKQRRYAEALPYAERAVQVWTQIGYFQKAQKAQHLLVQIRDGLRRS